MTGDDYYNMAVASGLWQSTPIYDTAPMAVSLMRFVEMVRTHEREACAKVCDDLVADGMSGTPEWNSGVLNCVAAIRARGEKP